MRRRGEAEVGGVDSVGEFVEGAIAIAIGVSGVARGGAVLLRLPGNEPEVRGPQHAEDGGRPRDEYRPAHSGGGGGGGGGDCGKQEGSDISMIRQ